MRGVEDRETESSSASLVALGRRPKGHSRPVERDPPVLGVARGCR